MEKTNGFLDHSLTKRVVKEEGKKQMDTRKERPKSRLGLIVPRVASFSTGNSLCKKKVK